jgi:hypothetical protein
MKLSVAESFTELYTCFSGKREQNCTIRKVVFKLCFVFLCPSTVTSNNMGAVIT